MSRSTENRYVKSIDLRDGGISSLAWSEQLYFVCLQNAHPAATQITLTSPLYNDSDGFAKAKVGETIPVIITTRDAGQPPPTRRLSLRAATASGARIRK
ncbi:hypothetical protein MYA98_07765 [Salmonella sp. WGH-01]|nr:hypothetical protein MYA98_07765 [Salmonella sp. WGH-01]